MNDGPHLRDALFRFLYGIAFHLLCSVAFGPVRRPASHLPARSPARLIRAGRIRRAGGELR